MTALGNVPQSQALNDFRFLVGGAVYDCPWYVADLISPVIAHLHQSDPTLDGFLVETVDDDRYFKYFLALGRGEDLPLNDRSVPFFLALAKELGNSDVYYSVLESSGDLSKVSQTLASLKIGSDFSLCPDPELEFLGRHFFELPKEILSQLSIAQLHKVLTHESLKVASEDALCDLLSSLCVGNKDYWALFEFVKFEHLSPDCVCQFLELLLLNFDCLTPALWARLCDRLVLPVKAPIPRGRYSGVQGRVFAPDMGAPLKGIIAHLTAACGGNVHDKGVVTISASSVFNASSGGGFGGAPGASQYAPKNVADAQANSAFNSQAGPDQWIAFDFQKQRIEPTDYAIRTFYPAYNSGDSPLSWVIEVSDDGVSWVEVDRRTQNLDLKDRNCTKIFKIPKPTECRHLRLRQTGLNQQGSQNLCMAGFEVFGTLFIIEPKP
jgi:hypothetical protein